MNHIDHDKLVMDLRNVATYLRFATDVPLRVSRLLYMAADEIEKSAPGPQFPVTTSMINDMRRAVQSLVKGRKRNNG
jgi:hypothetical protein